MKNGLNKILIILLMVVLQHGNAQDFKEKQKSNILFTAGVSAGQETLVGLPKMGIIKQYPMDNLDTSTGYSRFHAAGFYVGGDLSMFTMFLGTFSLSANCGFTMGPLTFDGSFTFLHTAQTRSDDEVRNQLTYSPKVGVNLGPIWIKAGPTIPVSKKTVDMGEWMTIDTYTGKVDLNVELLYVVRLNK